MRRGPSKAYIADLLHKGVVTSLLGLTFAGAGLCSWNIYSYLSVIKPERDRQKRLREQQILEEGASKLNENLM